MEKLQRIVDIFRKGAPVVSGLIKLGLNVDAQKAAAALATAAGSTDKEPTDAELDAVDATLDHLLDKFIEPMRKLKK